MTDATSPISAWVAACCAALAAAAIFGLYGVGEFYQGFAIKQGIGDEAIEVAELVFYAYYAFVGSIAVALLTTGLAATRVPDRTLSAVRGLLASPQRLVQICALLVFGGSVGFRHLVLLDQPIADDELTYDFIASTLLEGRVVNPAPIPPSFLKNQFVIASEAGWYGKYPIGHPLVLAVGKLLHVQELIVPALAALGVLLCFAVGRRLLDDRRAALACVLLAMSPQYVWTSGTQLSQPTSMVCMLLAMLGTLRLAESARLRDAALVGGGLGFGLLARPLPTALFIPALIAGYAALTGLSAWREQPRRRATELAIAGAGLGIGAGALLLVNWTQSGSAATSGYTQFHGSTGALRDDFALIASSLFSALMRQSFWLHGWPLSFVFVPFARFARGAVLVWGLIVCELSYRVFVPKAVVATTGPIYVFELVPLLCLASVAGAYRCAEWIDGVRSQPTASLARRWLLAFGLAGTLVSLAAFVPPMLRSALRGGLARARPFELLARTGAERALVFSGFFVPPDAALSWAYSAPNPAPDLSDDILFLQLAGIASYGEALKLWRERFADRRAFILFVTASGPELRELPLAVDQPLPSYTLWPEPR